MPNGNWKRYLFPLVSTYCFEWPTKSLVKDNSKHYRRCTEVQHETCPTSKGDQPSTKKYISQHKLRLGEHRDIFLPMIKILIWNLKSENISKQTRSSILTWTAENLSVEYWNILSETTQHSLKTSFNRNFCHLPLKL